MKNKSFHLNLWKGLLVDTKSHSLIFFFLFGVSGTGGLLWGRLNFPSVTGKLFLSGQQRKLHKKNLSRSDFCLAESLLLGFPQWLCSSFFSLLWKIWQKPLGGVYFGSLMEGAVCRDRKPQGLALKAVGCIMSTVQTQRRANDGAPVVHFSIVTLNTVR